MCDGNKEEQVEPYKYIGIEIDAMKSLTQRILQHVSAAKKAMHSLICTCAVLPISDSELLCKPLEHLVPLVLSYASGVFGVDYKKSVAAELLHSKFLKHYLGLGELIHMLHQLN